MDLISVASVRVPRTRGEAVCAPGEALLGGGTWLYSEPQGDLTGLVDLLGLAWPSLEVTDAGLSIAATCTFAELARFPAPAGWTAHPLLRQCCTALLGSFKVWNGATVGGNIALALPAGPMISLAAALDAHAVIWTPDGGERTAPVAALVTGVRSTGLARGEVLRSIEIPGSSMRARTGFRRIALSPIGRSGTLVIARVDEGGEVVVTVHGGHSPTAAAAVRRDARRRDPRACGARHRRVVRRPARGPGLAPGDECAPRRGAARGALRRRKREPSA